MTEKKPETTLEAMQQLNEALKNLSMAIDYEIHILRILETTTKRLAKLIEEKK